MRQAAVFSTVVFLMTSTALASSEVVCDSATIAQLESEIKAATTAPQAQTKKSARQLQRAKESLAAGDLDECVMHLRKSRKSLTKPSS